MEIKDLKDCITYAQRQAEDSCIPVVDDRTGYGYDSADYSEHQKSTLKHMMRDVQFVEDHMDATDGIFIISAMTLHNMLNVMTYESYAKLKRNLLQANIKRNPTFDEYKDALHFYSLDTVSDEALRGGYLLIADLWDDNERYGHPCDDAGLLQKNFAEIVTLFEKRK